MNGGAECAHAFTVDDPHAQEATFAAEVKVVCDHSFHVLWTKGVQIEDAIDGQLHRGVPGFV